MIRFPQGKINLGLYVLEKRPDGFHNIETVLYPVSLADILEVVVSEDNELSFAMSGIEIPGNPENNLCIRAYHLVQKKFAIGPVRIHLHKNIPVGGGLGGGSSDAVSMIKILNDLFGLRMGTSQMKEIAIELGSDCAFFLENKPALAQGRGEILTPVDLDLKDYLVIVVKPGVHGDTALAYADVIPSKRSGSILDIVQQPIFSWPVNLVNDFEKKSFIKHPDIKMIKDQFDYLGAIYSSMTGSGSAVYGIFPKTYLPQLHFPGSFIWYGKL
ncbi:MAG: 4-(cytidine 5'-diphospho)-2-C-methyl-D-erythritol kinase [Bacteroidales bacterium]|nr:4-(cytidine 5'-diphospho)-2-C-methyl-D-erythritol kinase [Bacteroidales bacterium]